MLGVVAQFLMKLGLCISVVIHTYNGEGNGTSWRKWGFVHLYLLKLWNHKSWNFFPAMQKTAKKKLHLCIISPWWISTQQIQGRKAKDGQIFGTSAGLFFQAAEVPELQPNQKPPSVLGWRSPNPSHPKWKRTRSTYLCLFVCFGAKKAKVDEGYSSGCGCGDFAVVIVVVVFLWFNVISS